jgi:hypothetical protein
MSRIWIQGLCEFTAITARYRFLENISDIDMPFLHSKSLLSGITIDRMEAWISKGLRPRKWHFEGRCHRKRIIGSVENCLGCE